LIFGLLGVGAPLLGWFAVDALLICLQGGLMVAIHERGFESEADASLPAPAPCMPTVAFDIPRDVESGISVTVDFEEPSVVSGDCRLTPVQKQALRTDLERECVAVQSWFAQRQWLPESRFDLSVIVSHRFRISKSLVPAWYGQRGRMEFPANRVASGTAAIAHELTHVWFPNANRFMAEGLAVHVQAEVGGNPAFPNFGEPLHELACKVLHDIERECHGGDPNDRESRPLLIDLDAIATPNPLTLKVGENFYGEGPRGQRVVYPIAGSFVAFLIETRGIAKFCELYRQTPFQPQVCAAGTSERWRNVYGLSVADLELEWKIMIAGCDRVALDI
jgi:hypothetical protein